MDNLKIIYCLFPYGINKLTQREYNTVNQMADILKPDVVWVEGKCYRVNEGIHLSNSGIQEDMYSDVPDIEYEDDGDDADVDIIELDSGRFSTSFHVPHHYYGLIIGKKALTKRKIESDTKTEIKIPKIGQSGDVTVLGANAGNVKAARRRINMIVASRRAKETPTHFISIPLNCEHIVNNFIKFKEEVLSENTTSRVEEAMFVSPATLHFTICVMSLMDNEERSVAANLLTRTRDTVMSLIGHGPIRIRLKGLSYMGEDPRETRVLYATPDTNNDNTVRLQKVLDEIYQLFMNAGIAKRDYDRDHVKIHMTLLKTRNAVNHEEGAYSVNKKTIDVTSILEKYADYEFGEHELKEMHLSQMSTTGADSYYSATCIISCLTN